MHLLSQPNSTSTPVMSDMIISWTTHLNFVVGNLGIWLLVCNIVSTQLNEIWRMTSNLFKFLKMKDDLNFWSWKMTSTFSSSGRKPNFVQIKFDFLVDWDPEDGPLFSWAIPEFLDTPFWKWKTILIYDHGRWPQVFLQVEDNLILYKLN